MLIELACCTWKSLKLRTAVSVISKRQKSQRQQQTSQFLDSLRCKKDIPTMIVSWNLKAATDPVLLKTGSLEKVRPECPVESSEYQQPLLVF